MWWKQTFCGPLILSFVLLNIASADFESLELREIRNKIKPRLSHHFKRSADFLVHFDVDPCGPCKKTDWNGVFCGEDRPRVEILVNVSSLFLEAVPFPAALILKALEQILNLKSLKNLTISNSPVKAGRLPQSILQQLEHLELSNNSVMAAPDHPAMNLKTQGSGDKGPMRRRLSALTSFSYFPESNLLETEQVALWSISHGGPFYTLSGRMVSGWSTGNDPCSWDGVTCSQVEKGSTVVSLSLDSVHSQVNEFGPSYSGDFPSWVATLTNLEELSFEQSPFFTGGFPEQYSSLINLKRLTLSGSGVTSLPNSIQKLQSLAFLDLAGCQLGVLPESMWRLAGLTHLNLDSNSLRTFPAFLQALNSLSFLRISNNEELEGYVPSWLEDSQELTYLDMCGTGLSLPFFSNFEGCNWSIDSYSSYRGCRFNKTCSCYSCLPARPPPPSSKERSGPQPAAVVCIAIGGLLVVIGGLVLCKYKIAPADAQQSENGESAPPQECVSGQPPCQPVAIGDDLVAVYVDGRLVGVAEVEK